MDSYVALEEINKWCNILSEPLQALATIKICDRLTPEVEASCPQLNLIGCVELCNGGGQRGLSRKG
jgi:hypothetical protein